MGRAQQFCTFTLDGHCFGVEVEKVQEVIRHIETTHVPLAHEAIRGLINLRGQIVTALDLRRRLGMPPLPGGRLPMNVVLRTGDGPVSLLVDQIGDVVEVDDSSFERPPDTLTGEARNLIRGAHKLSDRLLLVLETDQALRLPGGAEERRERTVQAGQ